MRNPTLQIRRPVNAVSRLSRRLFVLGLVTLLLSWPPPVNAAAGDLDKSFGSGGKVTTDFFGFFDGANAVAIQSDGRIVAGGFSGNSITGGDFALARYNSDGSLDTNFGISGKSVTDFGGIDDAVSAIAIQSNGKIVAAGHRSSNTSIDFALARYNTDGSLDTGFGSSGKVVTNFAFTDQAQAVIIQPDGKIVLAGFTVDNFNFEDSNFALARYNSDGSLDASFGVAGTVTTDFFGGSLDRAFAMARQPDGKIVVVGVTCCTIANGEDSALVRYNTDGSLDNSFGASGKIVTDFGGSDEQLSAVAIQSDGKIVAGGWSGDGTTGDNFALARYNTDGSLDRGFGMDGKTITDFEFIDLGFALSIQNGGKIIMAGITAGTNPFDLALARYNTDGSLDPSFGTAGRVITDFGMSIDQALALAIQRDGKIVAAGFTAIPPDGDFLIVRYEGIDASFDICLEDDSNGNVLTINSASGDYQFTACRSGLELRGTGRIVRKGSGITLQHNVSDRRVLAMFDGSSNRGTASVQVLSPRMTFTIIDRNTADNTCVCP